MSDMHVLAGDGTHWQVAMHFAVSDADNAVAVNYRTALVSSGLGGTTQLTEGEGPGQVATAEKIQIEAGEVYEHTIGFRVEGNGADTSAVRASLRKRYAREATLMLEKLQAQLKYFGHTESEA